MFLYPLIIVKMDIVPPITQAIRTKIERGSLSRPPNATNKIMVKTQTMNMTIAIPTLFAGFFILFLGSLNNLLKPYYLYNILILLVLKCILTTFRITFSIIITNQYSRI